MRKTQTKGPGGSSPCCRESPALSGDGVAGLDNPEAFLILNSWFLQSEEVRCGNSLEEESRILLQTLLKYGFTVVLLDVILASGTSWAVALGSLLGQTALM